MIPWRNVSWAGGMKMNNLHSKVMARYAAVRTEEEENQKKRKAEIYKRIPRISELETQMSRNSLNVARIHLKNEENPEAEIKKLRAENLNLRQEKMELLVSHGYPMDYMDLKYKCRKCNDTGFISGKKCTCYNGHLAEIVYEESHFRELMKDSSFLSYDDSLFDNQNVNPEYNKTVKENMRGNLKMALRYVSEFPIHSENLYFYGPSGTGKTFLASCIARELLNEGNLVVYRTSAQLMDDIKDIKFRDNKELERLIMDCDLLIIDDLGTEMVSDLAKTEIFNLVNNRLLHRKKMIISSNLKLENIRDKYSERLSSRIMGDFIFIPFFGDDLRLIKGQRKTIAFRNGIR